MAAYYCSDQNRGYAVSHCLCIYKKNVSLMKYEVHLRHLVLPLIFICNILSVY